MDFIILVDKANGNESVGTMWQETWEFDGIATLEEVWNKINNHNVLLLPLHSSERIIITKPHKKDK